MSRFKMLTLCALTVLAVGAMSASSASATFTKTAVECKKEGVPGVCVAEKVGSALLEVSGSEPIKESTTKLESGTKAVLEVPALELTITCSKGKASGTLEQPEPLVKAGLLMDSVITFSECVLTSSQSKAIAEDCKVVEPIKTKALQGEQLPTEPIHIEFTPESGKIFTEVEIGNVSGKTCPSTVKGINPVKGEQLCLITNGEENAVIHILACNSEGSEKLEFATNPARFSMKLEFELTSSLPFDFVLL